MTVKERWGEDNYFLSIFPVKFEGSRRLRMRYVIPAINMNGYTDIPFPTAFNTAVATYKITAGTGVSTVAMVNNSGVENELSVPATFTTGSTLYRSIVMIRPVTGSNDQKSRFYTASFNLQSQILTHQSLYLRLLHCPEQKRLRDLQFLPKLASSTGPGSMFNL